MDTKALIRQFTVAWFLAISGAAYAVPVDMLGETLTFLRAFPTPQTPYTVWVPSSRSTTVTLDSSDLIDWPVQNFQSSIDPSANTIDFRFPIVSRFDTANGDFDGFVISGFGHDILSAIISANDSGLQTSVTYGQRDVLVALNGPNLGGSTGFELTIAFAEPNSVPAPPIFGLIIAGVLVFFGTGVFGKGLPLNWFARR